MMPYHFFYQLVLFGSLVACLYAVLWPWPSGGVLTRRGQSSPARHAARALTSETLLPDDHKPPCAAANTSHASPTAPPVPPDPDAPDQPPPHVRSTPPALLSSSSLCVSGLGRSWEPAREMAIPRWPWRQLHCTSCGGYVPKRTGRFFMASVSGGPRRARDRLLAEGLASAARRRVFEVDPNHGVALVGGGGGALWAFSQSSCVIYT